MKTLCLIISAFLLQVSLANLTREVATVKNLESRGALFEVVGKTWISQDTAIMLTKIPSVDWSPVLNFINKSEATIEELCNQRQRFDGFLSHNCHHWHEEFEGAKKEVMEQLNRLNEWTVSKRMKRALINVVGQFSKFLFGTMDDNDAQDIYARLQNLEKHEGENLQVLKNGMAIIQSNAEFLRTALDNITENENAINDRLNQFQAMLKSEIKYISQHIRAVHIQAEINQVVLFLTAKLSKINKYLNDHFAILMTLQQGKLHPLVLSTKEIINAVRRIQANPLSPIMDDPIIIERITRVRTLSLQKDFIIQLEIPLVQKTEYTLNKVYSVPLLTSSSTYSILDMAEGFLLNNSDVGHVIEMSEREFRGQCIELKQDEFVPVYLCHQTQPIHVGGDPENCLLNMFSNPHFSSSECSHRIGKTLPNRLVKLKHANTWLFMLGQECILRARCQSEVHSIPLKGIGTLTLQQPCSFQLANLALPYDRKRMSPLEIHHLPVYNTPIFNPNKTILEVFESLTEPTPILNRSKSLRISHPQELKEFFHHNTKSIQEIQKDITRIETNRLVEKQKRMQQVHTYVSIPSISILTIGIVLYCVLRFIKRKGSRSPATSSIPLQTVVRINTRDEEQSVVPQTSSPYGTGPLTEINDTTINQKELKREKHTTPSKTDRVITIK